MSDAGTLRIETPTPREVVMTRVFAAPRQLVFVTTVLYPSQEVRDSVLKSGMERGAGESYDRLAELLASTRSS